MDLGTVVLAAGALVCAIVAGAHLLRRARRERKSAAAVASRADAPERVPLTLHPVINPDICIGSLSCLKSCPEGDILGMVGGSAQLIQPDHCIGHGRCAAECPVDLDRRPDRDAASPRPGSHNPSDRLTLVLH